jgi:hypothetical protein
VFFNYTADIFDESGFHFTTNECSMIVGFVMVLGTSTFLCLVNRLSRKLLFSLTSAEELNVEGLERFMFVPAFSLSIYHTFAPLQLAVYL